MMYGQSAQGLSSASGVLATEARIIHDAFRRRYPTYWAWTDREVVHAHINGRIQTVCGWMMEVNDHTGDRTLLNFQPQATCADIMRRAVALMADAGIAICEIVHDAVLIEDSVECLDHAVEVAKECWRAAAKEIIDFELQADEKVFKYPSCYEDEDGGPLWHLLTTLLAEAEEPSSVCSAGQP